MFQRHDLGAAAVARPSETERKASIRAAHRVFAKEAIRLTGLTQKALAEAAGFDRTVLSRLFSDNYDNVLSPVNIQKICSLTGQAAPGGGTRLPVLPDDAAKLARTRPRSGVRADAPDALPFAANDDVDLTAIVSAIVGRRSECDPWVVTTDDLAVVGLMRGDVLFVDRAARPVDGDLVFVQLYNWDQTWAGSIIRTLDRGRLVLPWTGISTPAPIEIAGANVAIMGPVTQSFRPRRHSQIVTDA